MNHFIKNRFIFTILINMIFVGLFGASALSIAGVFSDAHSDKMAFCDFMDGEMETDENEKEEVEEDDEKYKLQNFIAASLLKDFTKNKKDQILVLSPHFAEIPTPPPDIIA